MRALKITPTGSEIINIKPELESYRDIVGGNIDCVTIAPGKLVMVVNDEDDFTDIPSAVLPALMSVANLALAAYQISEGGVD